MKYLSEAKKSPVVLFQFSESPSNHNNRNLWCSLIDQKYCFIAEIYA